jgi:hypothetical protein
MGVIIRGGRVTFRIDGLAREWIGSGMPPHTASRRL